MLTCLGGAAAFAAPNPNTYLNGTFMVVNFDANLESDQLSITFDGAGNYSGTDNTNVGGTITSSSISGTYAVASNGTFTVDGGTELLSGGLSADGNTFLITKLVPGSKPEIDVGIKQGLVSNLNVASGLVALASNTSGANNTAFGYAALYSNTTGKGNAAQGVNSMYSNTTGIRNLGIGNNALFGNVSGSYNIALGFNAGENVTTGSDNIEIGASGASGDNATIQIGSQGTQTSTTIAGIFGTTVTGSAVYVTAAGQLGVLASSERYKTDVATMGSSTEKLDLLRPVTFKLKTDRQGTVQYGLIAEEVAKIYPELVIRNSKGLVEGVRYEELAPMLLNEMQKQRTAIRTLTEKQDAYAQKFSAQATEIGELRKLIVDMQAGLIAHRPTVELVAQQ